MRRAASAMQSAILIAAVFFLAMLAAGWAYSLVVT